MEQPAMYILFLGALFLLQGWVGGGRHGRTVTRIGLAMVIGSLAGTVIIAFGRLATSMPT